MADNQISTTCCIAGGGPAGMMLGFLLARAGIRVTVLEKHADFLRDFRGDTIHPSTLELMHELGLLDAFLKLPHSRVETLSGQIGETRVTIGDFRHLPTHCKFVALMPQWDFLDFLAERGRRFPNFDLRLRAEATDLVQENGRVAGVRTKTLDGELGHSRRSGGRLRWSPLHTAPLRGLQGGGSRRPDGRVVVPAVT